MAIFIDYDGTLTPIVPHPDDAILTESMRITLQRLANTCYLAIVSGRDLADVRERVGIDGIFYAGSHGFDISGPSDRHVKYQRGVEFLPDLDSAENELHAGLDTVPGCLVERKRFSIAVHYRQAEKQQRPIIRRQVESTRSAHPRLRLASGKKIFEFQPDIDWDKGKALQWLMEALHLDRALTTPLYIGDDVTDEDAFRTLRDNGIGILVTQSPRNTCARYYLRNPREVERFLNSLIEHVQSHTA
jgi:alpha,alpha-trehalase